MRSNSDHTVADHAEDGHAGQTPDDKVLAKICPTTKKNELPSSEGCICRNVHHYLVHQPAHFDARGSTKTSTPDGK